jgi:hypothetical protein
MGEYESNGLIWKGFKKDFRLESESIRVGFLLKF